MTAVTAALALPRPGFAQPRIGVMRRLVRLALLVLGAVVVLAGIVIAPLPGPFGLPISMVGLAIVLRNSYWAKRQFIRAQYARPKVVYPFRRLLRRRPEFAPVMWQQALRVEKVLLKRANRVLARGRKNTRRYLRKLFR
jgi:hypothetical protein